MAKVSRRQDELLDRILDRVIDAPEGLHDLAGPASPDALAQCALPEDEAPFWGRFDGVSLAHGEALILSLADIQTRAEVPEDDLGPGDRVIGERGRDRYILPGDPWAEGAAVVLVNEDGERSPEASSVTHLVLGWLGEFALLYDQHGDFADDLFGEDGELTPEARRRICRRRLDLDPDAPNPRLALAELLHEAGELAAARAELAQVLRRAPEFCWAHHELGRVVAALGDQAGASKAQQQAAGSTSNPDLRAYFLAWALAEAPTNAPKAERDRLASGVLELRPDFANHQAQAVAALIEREDFARAAEHLRIGLAVQPGHLELLRLRSELPKGS